MSSSLHTRRFSKYPILYLHTQDLLAHLHDRLPQHISNTVDDVSVQLTLSPFPHPHTCISRSVFMDTGFLPPADTGSCSYGRGPHLTSEVPGTACLLDSSTSYLYGPRFRPSPHILSTAFSSSCFFFPCLVVFGLTSVFFSLSIALFAVCTRLVDINIELEDTYIRYILFLDRLCNNALKMADAVGEAFLHTLARISSEFLDVVSSFSSTACRVRLSTFWILNQGLWVPFRLVESLFGLLYIARLGVQGKALTICAASRNVKSSPHPFRIPFRDAPRRAVESAEACFLLGAGWIYARGRSLYAVICAGATLGLGLVLRLPSGRIYSRAWSGAMQVSNQFVIDSHRKCLYAHGLFAT